MSQMTAHVRLALIELGRAVESLRLLRIQGKILASMPIALAKKRETKRGVHVEPIGVLASHAISSTSIKTCEPRYRVIHPPSPLFLPGSNVSTSSTGPTLGGGMVCSYNSLGWWGRGKTHYIHPIATADGRRWIGGEAGGELQAPLSA